MRARIVLLAALGLGLGLCPAGASADVAHVVAPGETLTSVAAADGLTIVAIAQANGISTTAELIAGQTLWIPPQTAAATTSSGAGEDADDDGDADAAATSSTGAAGDTGASGASGASGSSGASAGTSAVPVPTAERVSAAQIAAVASGYGVPANLAEAVAWQESGWNNDVVSSVGAVGVMQIVPATWTWIDQYLTPSQPLGPASASENIRAGVLLLRQLLQLTGGDEARAVAGYYQGLTSVDAVGMYPATRHYVADVLALAQRL